jgi:hypothetical protein
VQWSLAIGDQMFQRVEYTREQLRPVVEAINAARGSFGIAPTLLPEDSQFVRSRSCVCRHVYGDIQYVHTYTRTCIHIYVHHAHGKEKHERELQVVDSTRGSIQAALEERPPVVSFTFGLPAQVVESHIAPVPCESSHKLLQELVEAFRAAGSVVIGTATTVQEALALQANGVDAVCAQVSERHTPVCFTKDHVYGFLSVICTDKCAARVCIHHACTCLYRH